MEKDNSLLYACYINDMDLIKERIVGVTSAQLKKSTIKIAPVREITTLTLEKTKLSPYKYAKEQLSKYPEKTFISKNLELIDSVL